MNRCAYCLRPHQRKCACCCPEHTRKMSAHRGTVTAGRTRARKRIIAAIQKRERHRQRWRDIAMGRNVQTRLFEVFGVHVIGAPVSPSQRVLARPHAPVGASS